MLDPPAHEPPSDGTRETPSHEVAELARRHLRLGWWWLFGFAGLGLTLESMHGLKLGWYVDTPNEMRRLMWTLAHAHGAALGLVNAAFAFTVRVSPRWPETSRRLASACLLGASVLVPGGFFLGGLVIHSGDPGLGILLLPPGGVLLLLAFGLTATSSR